MGRICALSEAADIIEEVRIHGALSGFPGVFSLLIGDTIDRHS